MDLHIGSKGWRQVERRLYKHDQNGHSIGDPLPRGQWEEIWIVGETSRSWIVSRNPDARVDNNLSHLCSKLSKKAVREDDWQFGVAWSGEEVEAKLWASAPDTVRRLWWAIKPNAAFPDSEEKLRRLPWHVKVQIARDVGFKPLPRACKPNGEPWLIKGQDWKRDLKLNIFYDQDGKPCDADGNPVELL